jgi:hypothetical protein
LPFHSLFWFFAGVVLRAARCFKYCFGFIVFGFWAVAFSALVLTLPPTMHYKGPGKGAEFWIAAFLFNLFRSAAVAAAQRPAPEF